MHIFKHFKTITKHKLVVMKLCFKAGLYKQGLLHDLSKYSFVEFFNGVRFYQGTYSPNYNERKKKGYSEAWMHHKGRNKHHCEYWIDVNPNSNCYEPVKMPKKYLVESVCDRIAATKIYSGKSFTRDGALNYFYKEKDYIPMHEDTKKEMERILILYNDYNDKEFFKYLKQYVKEK